jgi:hypothetical protein
MKLAGNDDDDDEILATLSVGQTSHIAAFLFPLPFQSPVLL